MSSTDWIREDLSATEAEVAALCEGEVPPWTDLTRAELGATDAEVEGLVRRLQSMPAPTRRPVPVGASVCPTCCTSATDSTTRR